MRFGIMSSQMNALIPPGLPAEQALAHVAAFDLSDLVRELAALGFDPIELSGDLAMILPHIYAPPAIERLATLKDELGIGYTVHLPLWSVEPSTMKYLSCFAAVAQAWLGKIRKRVPTGNRSVIGPSFCDSTIPCSWFVPVTVTFP